ncbi:MAG TPA: hypothetical protein VF342_14340 [Alphaproteobacteria bacterium]
MKPVNPPILALSPARRLRNLVLDQARRLCALVCAIALAAWRDRRIRALGLSVLAIDFLFIAINFLVKLSKATRKITLDMSAFDKPYLSLDWDGGLPEIFGYVQTAATALLLLALARRTGRAMYAALGGIFLVILADDALMIHETLGDAIAMDLNLPWFVGLRPQDFGELAADGGMLLLVGALFVYGIRRSDRDDIDVALLFAAIVGAIAFFGVVVDMLVIELYYGLSRRFARLLSVLEDGGELVGMTLALLVAVTLYAGRHLSVPATRRKRIEKTKP